MILPDTRHAHASELSAATQDWQMSGQARSMVSCVGLYRPVKLLCQLTCGPLPVNRGASGQDATGTTAPMDQLHAAQPQVDADAYITVLTCIENFGLR